VIKDIAKKSVMSCRTSHRTFRVKLHQAGCRALSHTTPLFCTAACMQGKHSSSSHSPQDSCYPAFWPELPKSGWVPPSRNCLDRKYVLPGPPRTLRCAAYSIHSWCCAAPLVSATAPTS